MRLKWVSHLKVSLARHEGGSFKLEAPSRKYIVRRVDDTWAALPAQTIVKGFKKCKFVHEGSYLKKLSLTMEPMQRPTRSST